MAGTTPFANAATDRLDAAFKHLTAAELILSTPRPADGRQGLLEAVIVNEPGAVTLLLALITHEEANGRQPIANPRHALLCRLLDNPEVWALMQKLRLASTAGPDPFCRRIRSSKSQLDILALAPASGTTCLYYDGRPLEQIFQQQLGDSWPQSSATDRLAAHEHSRRFTTVPFTGTHACALILPASEFPLVRVIPHPSSRRVEKVVDLCGAAPVRNEAYKGIMFHLFRSGDCACGRFRFFRPGLVFTDGSHPEDKLADAPFKKPVEMRQHVVQCACVMRQHPVLVTVSQILLQWDQESKTLP